VDQQVELVKLAAFYDELEEIAESNPELYAMLKEAGVFNFLGKGVSKGVGRAGTGLATAAKSTGKGLATAGKAVSKAPGRLSDAAQLATINTGNAFHGATHHMPKSVQTGLHAGQHAVGHSLASTINPSDLIHHGAEFGLAGAGAHMAVQGVRAAAPAVGRLATSAGRGVVRGAQGARNVVAQGARNVGQGVQSLAGKFRMPGPPPGRASALA